MESKREARKTALDAVKNTAEEYLRSSDKASFSALFALREYKNADVVFTYVGVGFEPATSAIIEHALSLGKRVAVPKITARDEMKAVFISSTEELLRTENGLLEPEEGEEAVLSDRDVIILPAAAFSDKLDRLGRGGGYYDRFLATSRGIKIGIEREKLVLPELPTEEHDVPADILITEVKIRSRL